MSRFSVFFSFYISFSSSNLISIFIVSHHEFLKICQAFSFQALSQLTGFCCVKNLLCETDFFWLFNVWNLFLELINFFYEKGKYFFNFLFVKEIKKLKKKKKILVKHFLCVKCLIETSVLVETCFVKKIFWLKTYNGYKNIVGKKIRKLSFRNI